MLYSGSAQIDMEDMFDLDMALTMLEEPTSESGAADREQVEDAESSAQELINGMPTVAAAGYSCSVCMERFGSGADAKQIPCGHIFHSNCISHWVSLHNSCPLCRSSVNNSNSAKFIL